MAAQISDSLESSSSSSSSSPSPSPSPSASSSSSSSSSYSSSSSSLSLSLSSEDLSEEEKRVKSKSGSDPRSSSVITSKNKQKEEEVSNNNTTTNKFDVGEYSRIKSVDRVATDANEEHLNEKTNRSCEEVDKIDAPGRSIVHKCDSEVVKEVDLVLGDGGKLNNSSSSEKLLLQENGNFLSPSSNGDEGNNGLRQCRKVKKKKRKETVTECKLVEVDARNAAHQAIRDKNFETVATDSCPSQDKSLSISPQKKLKEVEVRDGSFEKAGFDLPDDALESHTKLQNGHTESKKVKKEKNKVMEDDDTHLDQYIIREKEPFQQEQDQYVVKEGKKEIAKEMATSGSCKREEKSPNRPKVSKRSGQHDGNPKGGDLGSLDYMEDNAGGGAKDRNQKNESLANDRNQRQNKILDDKKIEVVAGGSSASKRKKLTEVMFAEATLGNQALDLPDDVLKSPPKLQHDQGDLGRACATESLDIEAIKGGSDRKPSQNDKLADVTDERLHDDNGNALERNHSNDMKEKKKKNKQDLDDNKHLGKKIKFERNEVAKEEATDGSAK